MQDELKVDRSPTIGAPPKEETPTVGAQSVENTCQTLNWREHLQEESKMYRNPARGAQSVENTCKRSKKCST